MIFAGHPIIMAVAIIVCRLHPCSFPVPYHPTLSKGVFGVGSKRKIYHL